MNQQQTHIILKQYLEIEISSSSNDYQSLLEQFSEKGQKTIPALLEESLSKIVPIDEYWKIDKLELNLELDDINDLATVLKTQLDGLLKKELLQSNTLVLTSLQKSVVSSKPTGILSKESTFIGSASWILSFLKNGTLKWSTPKEVKLSHLNAELERLIQENALFLKAFIQLLKQEEALKRFLLYFDHQHLWTVSAFHLSEFKEKHKKQLLVQYAVIQQQGIDTQTKFWQKQLFTKEAIISIQKEANNHIKQDLFIENAGLILLHPFLSTLLKKHSLATSSNVLEPDTSASFLYSLVCGKPPEKEWQLVLPKLLLGLPTSKALKITDISKQQLKAGEELIQAAIQHWEVLANTSVENFRISFLQRPGRLKRIDGGWIITLEQRPYDLLIDQLPWQMSYIQLPWMNDFIKMEY